MKTSAQLASAVGRRLYNVMPLRLRGNLSNDERKAAHLPHDGFKQTEKDRRRALYNESRFGSGARRAASIVVAARHYDNQD